MEHPYSSGSWMVMPNTPNQIPSSASMSNSAELSQVHHIHHPQHQQHQQQHLHHLQQQHQQHQQLQQQQNHLQSLASHFHLRHLVESLAEATENGTRDQNSDALVTELTNQFDKCQQLLNSISGSISSKVMTVEGQKHKLEEREQLLNQRRDLIAKYKSSVEELVKTDYSK